MLMATKRTGSLRDRIVDFKRVKASELHPDERNWRSHPPAQRAALQEVLSKIGFAGAILVRKQGDKLIVIDGHLRSDVAEDQEVPVLVTDLTAKEAGHLLTVYDPIAAMAEANKEKLAELLSKADIATKELLGQLQRTAGKHLVQFMAGNDPEAIPDPPKVPVTKPGDLWLLGEHRLLCGDATDKADVERLMGGALAAAMWTDPPYGVNYVGKTPDALRLQNDDAGGLPALLAQAFANATDGLEPGAPFYISRPAGAISVIFGNAILAAGWQLHEELQWVKDSMVLGHSDYHVRHETIVYGWTQGPGRSGRGNHVGSRWYGDNSQTSVFEIARPKASPDHPTGKPVELVARCLVNSTTHAAIVYDPFLGSGTTLIAAEILHKTCYGLEIDPAYCDVIIQRWETFSDKQAKKV